MNERQIQATYNGLVKRHGEALARDLFLEKHPEDEGMLELFLAGEFELPEGMKYTAPEEELPEVADEDELPIVQETKAEVKAEKPKADKPKAEKKAKEIKAKGPSKAEQARTIYAKAEDKSRSAVTKIFMEQLGLSAAGASTYYQNCKKATV